MAVKHRRAPLPDPAKSLREWEEFFERCKKSAGQRKTRKDTRNATKPPQKKN